MKMISVSDLSSFLYCARKLYINRVLGIQEVPKEATIKGSVIHLAHELAHDGEESIVSSIAKVDKAFIFDIFSARYADFLRDAIKQLRQDFLSSGIDLVDFFEHAWPAFKKESELRASEVFEFAHLHNLVGGELWERLVPKIESEIFVSSYKLNLRGRIDRLEVFKDCVIPVELKSGACPPDGVWPSHLIQVGAYLLLLKDSGQVVKEARVYYVDHDCVRTVLLNPFLEGKILGLVEAVGEALSSPDAPPVCDNPNKCKSCGLKAHCEKLSVTV